jgi:hypothetical protein
MTKRGRTPGQAQGDVRMLRHKTSPNLKPTSCEGNFDVDNSVTMAPRLSSLQLEIARDMTISKEPLTNAKKLLG